MGIAVSSGPLLNWGLARSYAYCERLAARAAGNFYHAFRLLPRDQRRAMCALYSFLRIADDRSDGPGTVPEKRAALAAWCADLHCALEGSYRHPLYPALHHTVEHFHVPHAYLEDALDGVGMDLDITHYDTFDELYRYCYRVASAVGLACIHVWGFANPEALAHAEAAGVALQLTNILRDLGEDAARGRTYLPREELVRFGVRNAALEQGAIDDNFRALMRFEVERAYHYYESAQQLAPLLPAAGRAVFLVMLRTYRGVLDDIVRNRFDVFGRRARVSRWHKLWLVLRALPVRWGWSG